MLVAKFGLLARAGVVKKNMHSNMIMLPVILRIVDFINIPPFLITNVNGNEWKKLIILILEILRH